MKPQRIQAKCTQCDHLGPPILKMGGLICEECRVILYYPGTPEYKLVRQELKEREEKDESE